MIYSGITKYQLTMRVILNCFGIFVNIVFIESQLEEETELKVITKQTTWSVAERQCLENGGRLAKLENVEKMLDTQYHLQHHTTQDFVTFWIGGREVRSNWVWSHDQRPLLGRPTGCFHGNMSFVAYMTVYNNHPELCTAFCKTSRKRQFAALQGQKCYCISDTYNLERRPQYECSATCTGNPQDFCGGPNVLSVYSTWDAIAWGIHEPTTYKLGKDCATVKKENGNITWYSEYCRQEHYFICSIEEETICTWLKSKTPCLYVISEKANWFKASYICTQMHGYLVNKDEIRQNNLNLTNAYYWSGLTRKKQVWVDGTTIGPSLRRHVPSLSVRDQLCMALQYRRSAQWGLTSIVCHRMYPSLCEIGMNLNLESYDEFLAPLTNNSEVTTQFNKQATEKKESFLDFKTLNLIFIPIACGLSLIAVVTCLIICAKRKRNKMKSHTVTDNDPFYYILEKQQTAGVYNQINLDPCNPNFWNYNHLKFNGTLKQLVHDSACVQACPSPTEGKSTTHNAYDTINCQVHQYDTVSHNNMKIFCVQEIYDRVV